MARLIIDREGMAAEFLYTLVKAERTVVTILQPEQYQRDGLRPHGGLSAHDRAQVKLFYPPHDDAGNPELKPFRSQTLSLAPAQQVNFTIQPTSSRPTGRSNGSP